MCFVLLTAIVFAPRARFQTFKLWLSQNVPTNLRRRRMGPVIRRLLRFVGGLLGSSWLRLRAALRISWFSLLWRVVAVVE